MTVAVFTEEIEILQWWKQEMYQATAATLADIQIWWLVDISDNIHYIICFRRGVW